MALLSAVLLLAAVGAPQANPQARMERCFYFSRLLFVNVAVNGKKDCLFLIDTGANKSAIDKSFAAQLNIKPTGKSTVEGTAGTAEVENAKLSQVSLAGVSMDNLDVTMQPLNLLSPPEQKAVGILGSDFLRHFCMKVDYKNRQISLSPTAHQSILYGDGVEMKLDNGIPRIPGMLNGKIPADFRIDTGASLFESKDIYLNITTPVWEELTKADAKLRPQKYFTGTGVGGEIQLAVARIDQLKLNRLIILQPSVIVQPKQGYFAREDAVGFVSNNLLEKYSPVILDYVGNRLYFSKS